VREVVDRGGLHPQVHTESEGEGHAADV
jgi:hypothetical protein